jgi:exopolysaccharide production protein ExoZ
MRALAALLVTFVHIDIFVADTGLTQSHLRFGNIGVDLFFVLSGFVIVHSTAKRTPTSREFMISRIVRVVPLYWLLTLCVFAVAIIAPQLLNATRGDPMELLKSLLFIPYVKGNGLVQPVLFVGWTLNYEMFFYTSFAVFLMITRRGVARAVAYTSIFIVGFTLLVQLIQPPSVVLRFFGYPIVLEFVMGMWIALAARRWPDHVSRLPWPIIAAAVFWLALHMIFIPDAPRWLAAGVPSAAILWSALMLERSGSMLSNRLIQNFGAASYALYLSHAFVLQGLGKLVEPVNGPIVGPVAAVVAIAVAHFVGLAIHMGVERPLVDRLKAGLRRSGLANGSGKLPAPTTGEP